MTKKHSRYKPVGWRGEPHRHYLAGKGIKTKRKYESERYMQSKSEGFSVGDVVIAKGVGKGRIISEFGPGRYRVEDLDAAGSGIYDEDDLREPTVTFFDPERQDIVLDIEDPEDTIDVEFDLDDYPRGDEPIAEFDVPVPTPPSREDFRQFGIDVREGAKQRIIELRNAGEITAEQAKRLNTQLEKELEQRRKFERRLDPIRRKEKEQREKIQEARSEIAQTREKRRLRGTDTVPGSEEFWKSPLRKAFDTLTKKTSETARTTTRRLQEAEQAARAGSVPKKRQQIIKQRRDRLTDLRGQAKEQQETLRQLQKQDTQRRERFRTRRFEGDLPK